MRTFHIGGAATKASEENRVYMKYPVIISRIIGNTVKLENGDVLFTRKGFILVNKIFESIKLEKNDEVLIDEGGKVISGQPVLKRGSEEIVSREIAYVTIKDNVLYLISQNRKLK